MAATQSSSQPPAGAPHAASKRRTAEAERGAALQAEVKALRERVDKMEKAQLSSRLEAGWRSFESGAKSGWKMVKDNFKAVESKVADGWRSFESGAQSVAGHIQREIGAARVYVQTLGEGFKDATTRASAAAENARQGPSAEKDKPPADRQSARDSRGMAARMAQMSRD